MALAAAPNQVRNFTALGSKRMSNPMASKYGKSMPKTRPKAAALNRTTTTAKLNQSSVSSRKSNRNGKQSKAVKNAAGNAAAAGEEQQEDEMLKKLELILLNCDRLTCAGCQMTTSLEKFFAHFDPKLLASGDRKCNEPVLCTEPLEVMS